jgi:hypothetical protein
MKLRPAVPYIHLEDQEYWKEIDEHFVEKGLFTPIKWISIKTVHKEKIRQFQLQELPEDRFVRPEKPIRPLDRRELEEWADWQPIIRHNENGELWDDSYLHENLDHIIMDADNLFWNPCHPKVKELYYPDLN